MPEYRLRPKARRDLDRIWDYSVRTWGGRQARRYLTDIRDVLADLAANSHIGKARGDLFEGLRVYPVGRHLIFYLTTDKGIDVVRILHERMDIDRHLS